MEEGVDPHGASGGPAMVGLRLREQREAKSLSLRTLAKQVGVSASLISQVEHGRAMPSVGTLYALVRELSLSMDALFSEQAPPAAVAVDNDEPGPVQRRQARDTIYLASGVRWQRMTRQTENGMDFLLAHYDVGAESCPADRLISHDGAEYGYVVRGTLGVTVGRVDYALEAGDSISFLSTTPHRLWSAGGDSAEAIWLVVGRGGDSRVGQG